MNREEFGIILAIAIILNELVFAGFLFFAAVKGVKYVVVSQPFNEWLWEMPIYITICVYALYTLCKLFFGRGGRGSGGDVRVPCTRK